MLRHLETPMVHKRKRKPKRMLAPPKPKVVHHVVPKSWQKLFAAPALAGKPFYFDCQRDRASGPEGPGDKMAEEYANALFDRNGFQVDDLEDRLGRVETRLVPIVKDVLAAERIEPAQRPAIAEFLAVQCCRYPDLFEKRLDRGRELAIELKAARNAPDSHVFQEILQGAVLGLPANAFSDGDLSGLRNGRNRIGGAAQ
jgi:uncharacterized protein DUF4238